MAEQNPGTVRDQLVADRDRGGFVFRNRWQDDEDIVASFWLDSNFRRGGWGSAEGGEFRIMGLGVDWAVRGMGWGNGGDYRSKTIAHPRLYQNNVFVPEGAKNGTSGVVVRSEVRADGSGFVTANLDRLYQPARGTRCFAADYSGRSGAPALFGIADRLAGSAGTNTWQLVTEKAHRVAVDGNSFTITAANGASLRGTVLVPAAAKIAVENKTLRHEINYHGGHKRADYPRQVISVAGFEEFLVVLTLQQGAAPAVKREGDLIQVGGQTMRLAGPDLAIDWP
jgi:hypothetical protein